jgi:hypothetical protein
LRLFIFVADAVAFFSRVAGQLHPCSLRLGDVVIQVDDVEKGFMDAVHVFAREFAGRILVVAAAIVPEDSKVALQCSPE